MKRFYTIMAALLVCGVVYAAQDTDISLVEARNPKRLRTWLNANATDAEARLAAGGSVADRLTLNNPVDAGTASIVMQADKGDNAGDKWGIVASDGSGLLIQSDASSLGVLATKVTIGTTGIITLPGGATLDNATSATALTITETTVAVVGAATVSGAVTASGGLTVTEDIVVTLDATDEEISIAQTDTTGASGVPMMFINDDRTGGNADQAAEATISIDAEGVYGLAINDGALYVEGVSLLVGNVTLTGDIDIDGGDITCPADLTITPTGNDVLIDGGLTIGDATQAGDNNLRVVGTSALVGVATFTALPVFNAGLDVNEDIDIDLDAADEEINITQSAAAGTADTPLILINDARTGETANTAGEATLKIDAEGTHAIAVLDGIVAVESILDTYAAGALLLGSAEATSVEIADAGVTTDIQGPVTVLGSIDTAGAVTQSIASANAVLLTLGASDIDTTVLGPLNVLEATGKGIDTSGAGALFLGESVATSVSIGKATGDTTILGPLNVLEATGKGIDTTGGGALYLGEVVATSVVLGASDAPTTVAGGLKLKYASKSANYTNTANDVVLSYNTTAVTTNTLPEASTVLGSLFVISLEDDDGDLVVMTDGTDKFDGTNDILTFDDAGDSCAVIATAENVYTILVNVGGTLSD